MTVTDKAKEIVSNICHLNADAATELVRAHLNVAHDEGFRSGIEHARQVLNDATQVIPATMRPE